MTLNWPIITVLFCLALPGVFLALPRLIVLLLPNNSPALQKKISRIAIAQTLVMVLLMSIAGAVLSTQTGLGDPILNALLTGKAIFNTIQDSLLPIFLYTLGGLIVFLLLYYGLAGTLLDEPTLLALRKLRAAIGLDGCILYGGVVEEILARWGLMNVIVYFAILFAGQKNNKIIWTSIIVSGLFFTLGHLPAYLAAGCHAGRRFTYIMMLLTVWQAILFGWLFWQYGLFAAIVAHMLFHWGWSLYDKA